MECNQTSVIKSLLEISYDLDPKQDPYQDIIPSLSREPIKNITTYFRDNRITLKEDLELSEEELKTISYLAEFYRKRVAYNPMAINIYLATLGYCKWNDKPVQVVCYKKGMYGEPDGRITFDEWKALGDDKKKEYVTTNDLFVTDVDKGRVIHNDLFLRHGKYKFTYPPMPSMFPYIYSGVRTSQGHRFNYVFNSDQLDNKPPYIYSGLKSSNSAYFDSIENTTVADSKPPYIYSGLKSSNSAYLEDKTSLDFSKTSNVYVGLQVSNSIYFDNYKIKK